MREERAAVNAAKAAFTADFLGAGTHGFAHESDVCGRILVIPGLGDGNDLCVGIDLRQTVKIGFCAGEQPGKLFLAVILRLAVNDYHVVVFITHDDIIGAEFDENQVRTAGVVSVKHGGVKKQRTYAAVDIAAAAKL